MKAKTDSIGMSILNAARDEFLKGGFKAASIRTIAENAGVTTGAIYNRFEGKEEIFDALVSDVAEEMMKMMLEAYEAYFSLIGRNEEWRSFDLSAKNQEQFWDFVFKNRCELTLIVSKSEGTKYADYLNDMMQSQFTSLTEYNRILKDKGTMSKELHPEVCRILVKANYEGFFEIVAGDCDINEAMARVEELSMFYNTGWKSILRYGPNQDAV